jgi:hypothetical protein
MKKVGRIRYRPTKMPSAISIERRAVWVSAVADALEKFIEKRYRGIAELERGEIEERLVVVSPDAFAYVAMMLLNAVHGKQKIHFKIETKNGRILLKITPISIFTDDPCREFDFIRAVRESGLEVDITDEEYVLFADIARPAIFHVYATSSEEMYAAFLRVSDILDEQNGKNESDISTIN